MHTWLILADGSVFGGWGFGHPAPFAEELQHSAYTGIGEVVFNTAMSGYHEVLTDPSYTGQIVAMTYPHIGNYGVSDDWNESGPQGAGSVDVRPVKVAGFVLRSLYEGPVPPGRQKLHDYLREHEIPGIRDVDTRRLTLGLREGGSINGILMRSRSSDLSESERAAAMACLEGFPSMEGRSLVSAVGSREIIAGTAPGASAISIALYDCGAKANIMREFRKLGCAITIIHQKYQPKKFLQENIRLSWSQTAPETPRRSTIRFRQSGNLLAGCHCLAFASGIN